MPRLPALAACSVFLMLCLPALLTAQSNGPRLRFAPAIGIFDTASCNRTSTLDITIENTGDEAATISEIDDVVAPFEGSFAVPLTIPPGSSRTFPLTYTPPRAPRRDSLVLNLVADNPVPTAMAFLFDASSDMGAAFGSGSRVEAAKDAAGAFIDDIMAAENPAHEGAVYAYSATSQFRLLRGFTDDAGKVKGALPTQATGAEACPWDAMHRTIGFLQTRPLRKVMIVFLASEDAGLQSCGPRSAAGVISSAQSADVRVHCIAFTDVEQSDLQNIAAQTGGSYARVTNAAELTAAMTDVAATLTYDVPQQYVLRGEAVAPALRIAPPQLVFRATQVGAQRARSFMLHNEGNAPLHIYSIEGLPAQMRCTIPSAPIGIGDSAEIPIDFIPSTQGYVEGRLAFDYNACGGGSETCVARGVGYEAAHPDPGPMLVLRDPVGNFGDVDCSGADTLLLTMDNPGSREVEVSYVRQGNAHFLPSEGEIDIPAEGSKQLPLIFRPDQEIGVFSGSLGLRSVSRGSVATVVVADLGVMTREKFEDNLPFHSAVQLALEELTAGLAITRGLDDRLGVVAAEDPGVRIVQDLTGNKADLAALLFSSVPIDSTCVIPALSAAMDMLEGSTQDKRILLFTAQGDPDPAICADTALAPLIARALDAQITVHVIPLRDGLTTDALAVLAGSSGGRPTPAYALARLREELEIVEVLSQRERRAELLLSARSVSAQVELPESLPRFPDTRVGEQSCRDMTIRNSGDGPLVISAAEFFHDDYRLETPLPISVAVGDSTAVRICFAPRLPGEISSGLRLLNNSCAEAHTPVFLSGLSWDSSAVTLGGEFSVRPGGLVRIPVMMTTDMDADFNMRALDFSVTYNPTLLYPDEVIPAETPDGSSLFSIGGGRIVQGFDAATHRATTTYIIQRGATAPPITTSGSTRTIAYLRLRAYLGNSMETTVTIDTVHSYVDGLTLGSYGQTTVRLDSLTWLEQRLVDPSALYGVSLGKHAPNPVRDEAVISYMLQQPASVRLAVYDSFGRRVALLAQGWRGVGRHQVVFHADGLPAGMYLYRLETPAGVQARSMLISR